MRVRNAMIEQRELLKGVVEMDETYIGGKRKGPRGRGALGKTPVVGMVARGGKIVAKRVFKVDAKVLTSLVREKVKLSETTMMTDEFRGYSKLKNFIPHKTINHSKWYVDGDTHTNTIEGFWSLLKRGIVGQFHKVSAHRLPKYIDEFCFRYNHRGEADVFETLLLKSVTL